MRLETGTRLGEYEVIAALGEGGMGEVYRAHDHTLGRDVALKVLPARVAADRDRVDRFRREARVLASLNHPNIAAIYGFEETSAASFLVMELVDGPTLAEVIAETTGAGPPRGVKIEDALAIARQIAEALEEAHERGVVHRDLKPANVKLTGAGRVKVLDFGLAKVVHGDSSGPRAGDPSGSFGEAQTVTSPAMTSLGMILGTAAYMAPEQARGRAVDRRADIWAFGVLLYEMLSGRQLFRGETVTDVISQVVTMPIDLAALPAAVPAPVRPLVARCLDRDPSTRLRDIGEARITLDRAIRHPEEAAVPQPERRPGARWVSYLGWGVAAIAGVVAAIALSTPARQVGSPEASRRTLSALLPPPGHGFNLARGPMAFSPDDSQIAFCAIDERGQSVLALRALADTDARPIPGTEDASYPFWSPDGRSVGYFAKRKLVRIDVDGANRRVLADAPLGAGGTWNSQGVIVFAPGGWGAPLAKVGESGGPVTSVADTNPNGFTDHMTEPSFLPDGTHFLFATIEQSTEGAGIWLGSTDGSAPRHLLKALASTPVFVDPGLLMFWTPDHRVLARPFDPRTFAVGAEETVVATDVGFTWIADGLFAASRHGLVAYLPAGADNGSSELVWVDRQGRFIERITQPGGFYAPRLSHDNQRVAVDNSDPLADVLVFGMAPGRPPLRLTDDPADETLPVWSPDDSTVYFYRGEKTERIFRRRLVDGAKPEMVVDDAATLDVSADGRWLLFRRHVKGTSDEFGLWLFDLLSSKEQPWVTSPYSNRTGTFAPSGGWIAYSTNESGRSEVYLQTFPVLGAKIPVSTDGGTTPLWTADGRHLYYRSLTDQIMEVPVTMSDRPEVGTPRALFEMRLRALGGWAPQYGPAKDTRRFMVNRMVEQRSAAPMMLVQNWRAGQRR